MCITWAPASWTLCFSGDPPIVFQLYCWILYSYFFGKIKWWWWWCSSELGCAEFIRKDESRQIFRILIAWLSCVRCGAWNVLISAFNFISVRGNLPEIIPKLFRRFIAPHAYDIFQHVRCRWNDFETIFELLQRLKSLYFDNDGDDDDDDDYYVLVLCLLVHKCFYHKHLLPKIYHEYFQPNQGMYSYETRNKADLYLRGVNTIFGHRCIKFKGALLWNDLPDYIKNIHSINKFKIKSYLQQNYILE